MDQTSEVLSTETLRHEDLDKHAEIGEESGGSGAAPEDDAPPVSNTAEEEEEEEKHGSELSCSAYGSHDNVHTSGVESSTNADKCCEGNHDVLNAAESNADEWNVNEPPAAEDGTTQAEDSMQPSTAKGDKELLGDEKKQGSVRSTSSKRKMPLPKPPALSSKDLDSATLPPLKSRQTRSKMAGGNPLPTAKRQKPNKTHTANFSVERRKEDHDLLPAELCPRKGVAHHQVLEQNHVAPRHSSSDATQRHRAYGTANRKWGNSADLISGTELRHRRKEDEERHCHEMLSIARSGRSISSPRSRTPVSSASDGNKTKWVPFSRGVSHFTSMSRVHPSATEREMVEANKEVGSTLPPPSQQNHRGGPEQQHQSRRKNERRSGCAPPLQSQDQPDAIQRCLDFLRERQKNDNNDNNELPMGYSYNCVLSSRGSYSQSQTFNSCRIERYSPARFRSRKNSEYEKQLVKAYGGSVALKKAPRASTTVRGSEGRVAPSDSHCTDKAEKTLCSEERDSPSSRNQLDIPGSEVGDCEEEVTPHKVAIT